MRAVAAALLLALNPAPSVPASLPHMAGGEITVHARSPVATTPSGPLRNALDLATISALYAPLYEQASDGTVVPVLAAGPPTLEGSSLRVPLREGITIQRRKPLTASAIARALAPALADPRHNWVFGVGSAVTVVGDANELLFRGLTDADALARGLSGLPYRVAVPGTGAFVSKREVGSTVLRANRTSPLGAPFVDLVRIKDPLERSRELIELELGQLDGSFQGDSAYGGAPARPLGMTRFTPRIAVTLVCGRALRSCASKLATLAPLLDDSFVEQLGIEPTQTISATYPAPRLATASRDPITLTFDANDPLMVDLARAFGARAAERNITVWARGEPDPGSVELRLVVDPLRSDASWLGQILAEAGWRTEALQLASAGFAPTRELVYRVARDAPYVLLGVRADAFYYRADLLLGSSPQLPLDWSETAYKRVVR